MATPEISSSELNTMTSQEPLNDTVMADSVEATMSGVPEVGSHDSDDEITTKDEKVSDAGSGAGSDDASDDESNGNSKEGTDAVDGEGGDDGGSNAGDEAGGGEDDNDCGPWPTNSTYTWSHEPFETYKLKVTQLCLDLGFGEPVIERMDGGGFNRIIGLKFPASPIPDLALRIPRMLDEDQFADLQNQVALASYLSQYDFLHAPKIFGYDSTTSNALGQMYVLQERIPGTCAGDIFYELPLSEKLQIMTLVAEMLIELESVGFDKPGRPVGISSLPRTLPSRPNFTNAIEIAGFRFNPMTEMERLEKQPLSDFLISLFEIHKQKYPHPKTDQMFDKLAEISKEMLSAGLMRAADSENVIFHWDLSGNNVIIQRSETVKADATVESTSRHDCQHAVKIKVEDTDVQASRHTVRVQIEDSSSKSCGHDIEVTIEGASGKKYQHRIQISNGASIGQSSQTEAVLAKDLPNTTTKGQKQSSGNSASGQWVITGVIDWDDALSVPLVLSRKPPSWLWFDEKGRDWSQNRDTMPDRDLTEDELLIKAQFDQIMEKARPGYIEDTYHRGIWLRKLARYALEGFNDGEAWKRYNVFVKEWSEYYATLRG
jgi:hypothetical protein